MAVVVAASKGKWIPGIGTRDAPSRSSYWCDSCDRQFTSKSCLDRHLTTELHFKRAAQRTFSGVGAESEDFDQYIGYEPRRSCRKGKGSKYVSSSKWDSDNPRVDQDSKSSRRRKAVGLDPTSDNNQCRPTHMCCPTCYSKVDKKQMGKHLISHFHCQRTRTARLANPELSLILDHIHDIIIQSPYQCATCKFYFTQKEQFLAHVREKHMQDEVGDIRKWNCSACSRQKFANNGHKLLEHLKSSSHRVVEAAIAKSIPIIIRQVSPHSCPVEECNKMFILNRELASHIQAQHGVQFLSLLKNDFFNFLSVLHDSDSGTDDEQVIPKGNDSLISNENRLRPDIVPDELTKQANRVRVSQSTLQQTPLPLKLVPQRTQSAAPQRNANSISIQHFLFKSDATRTAGAANEKFSVYACQSCDYSTRKKSHFTRHVKTHDGPLRTKDFHCTECPSSFYERGALVRHQRIHSGKTVHCPVPSCAFVGLNQSEVKSHSVVHNPTGSFRCKLCKYSTKSPIHLKRHQLLVHKIDLKNRNEASTTVPIFNCMECTFKTSTANGLRRHSLQHTEESPYLCPYCDVRTKNIENLRTHVLKRQLHAGKHLYRCSLCVEGKAQHKKPFATNKFLEFRKHVEYNHATHAYARSQKGIFIIAGIQKAESVNQISEPTVKPAHARQPRHCPTVNSGSSAEKFAEVGDAFNGNPHKNAKTAFEESFNMCTGGGDQEVQDVIQLTDNAIANFEMDSDSAIFVLDNYTAHTEYVHVLLETRDPDWRPTGHADGSRFLVSRHVY